LDLPDMEADFIDSCALRKCRRLLLLGWLLLVVGCTQEQLSGEVAAISAVDYVLSDSTSPPPPTANWQPYQLPHGSRWPQPSQSHLIYWFRASLPEQATAQLQGLYFYRYSESIDVYVNGVYLGGDSHKPGFDTAAWNHPLLVAVQPASWRSFDNQVLIRFEATKLGGVFAGFLVGDYQQLRALYDERYFQQITVNQWLLSLGVVATALALVLWLARRQEPLLWQFAASSCCWLVVTTHMVLYYLPVPDQWWLPFVHMAIDGWIYFLCRFMSTWFGLANAKQLRWQRYLLLLALLWHALAPLPAWWPLAYVLHSIGIGFVLYSQCLGAVACRAAPQLQRSLLLIVLLQVLCYGHDLFALVLAVQPSWQTASHWSQLVFPLLQIIFLLHLLRRYLHALTVAETLNAGLEARVASAKQALQVAYAQAHQAELQKVAEQERIRIYRDLHDEVGFKLLSIVHGGRDSTAAALASAALTNLREAVARANKPPLALAFV
jgi:hypothetical protein